MDTTGLREFRVYTFAHARPGKHLRRSDIRAYTTWANESWDGCVVYNVFAENGTEAKRKAREMRWAGEISEDAEDGS